MSVLRKAAVYLGLYDDEEDDGVYEYDEDGYELERPPSRVAPRHAAEPAPVVSAPGQVRAIRDPMPMQSAPSIRVGPEVGGAVRAVAPARVTVVEPHGFNDAQDVGDRLRAGSPVILNLQGLEKELQRRLIDFSSGLCYALGGTMAKAADHVFLLTPPNVEVTDDEKNRLRDRGLYRN